MEKNNAQERLIPAGKLVVIGGKEDKGNKSEAGAADDCVPMEILKCFAALINVDDPVIEVITSASSEGDESFEDYKKVFEQLGIRQMRHLHHKTRKEVLDNELEERIQAAQGFFFSGGDQLLLTSLYGGSRFLTRLKERYIRDNIVIGGTSAGAMAMSTTMIYAGSKEVQQISGEVKITTGFEFLKDVCVDTHFVDRGRFVRLAQVVATNPSTTGIGIEEDTALIVRNGCEGEVIGSGTIIVIDGSGIEASNVTAHGEGERISVRNLQVHILSKGDTYTIRQLNPAHR